MVLPDLAVHDENHGEPDAAQVVRDLPLVEQREYLRELETGEPEPNVSRSVEDQIGVEYLLEAEPDTGRVPLSARLKEDGVRCFDAVPPNRLP